jgi:hypothetical protein
MGEIVVVDVTEELGGGTRSPKPKPESNSEETKQEETKEEDK